jgi:hypothetical protein
VKRAHRVYDPHNIKLVLTDISQLILPVDALTQISRETGILGQTLGDWRQKRINHATDDWVSLAEGRPKKRSLPSYVEVALNDMLRTNYLRSGTGATRKTLAELATNTYTSLPIDEMRMDRFCASPRFVAGLFTRRDLTLGKPHPERRTDGDADYVLFSLKLPERRIGPIEFVILMKRRGNTA